MWNKIKRTPVTEAGDEAPPAAKTVNAENPNLALESKVTKVPGESGAKKAGTAGTSEKPKNPASPLKAPTPQPALFGHLPDALQYNKLGDTKLENGKIILELKNAGKAVANLFKALTEIGLDFAKALVNQKIFNLSVPNIVLSKNNASVWTIEIDIKELEKQKPYSELTPEERAAITKESRMDLLVFAAMIDDPEAVKSIRYNGSVPIASTYGILNQYVDGRTSSVKNTNPIGFLDYVRNDEAFNDITNQDLKDHLRKKLTPAVIRQIKEAFSEAIKNKDLYVIDSVAKKALIVQFNSNLDEIVEEFVEVKVGEAVSTSIISGPVVPPDSQAIMNFKIGGDAKIESNTAFMAAKTMTALFTATGQFAATITRTLANYTIIESPGNNVQTFSEMGTKQQKKILEDLRADKNLLVDLYINMIQGSEYGMYGPNFENLVVTKVDGQYARVPVTLGVHGFTVMGNPKTFENTLTPSSIRDFIGISKFIGDDNPRKDDLRRIKSIYAKPAPEQIARLQKFITTELPILQGQLRAKINEAYSSYPLEQRDTIFQVLNARIEAVKKFDKGSIYDSVGLLTPQVVESNVEKGIPGFGTVPHDSKPVVMASVLSLGGPLNVGQLELYRDRVSALRNDYLHKLLNTINQDSLTDPELPQQRAIVKAEMEHRGNPPEIKKPDYSPRPSIHHLIGNNLRKAREELGKAIEGAETEDLATLQKFLRILDELEKVEATIKQYAADRGAAEYKSALADKARLGVEMVDALHQAPKGRYIEDYLDEMITDPELDFVKKVADPNASLELLEQRHYSITLISRGTGEIGQDVTGLVSGPLGRAIEPLKNYRERVKALDGFTFRALAEYMDEHASEDSLFNQQKQIVQAEFEIFMKEGGMIDNQEWYIEHLYGDTLKKSQKALELESPETRQKFSPILEALAEIDARIKRNDLHYNKDALAEKINLVIRLIDALEESPKGDYIKAYFYDMITDPRIQWDFMKKLSDLETPTGILQRRYRNILSFSSEHNSKFTAQVVLEHLEDAIRTKGGTVHVMPTPSVVTPAPAATKSVPAVTTPVSPPAAGGETVYLNFRIANNNPLQTSNIIMEVFAVKDQPPAKLTLDNKNAAMISSDGHKVQKFSEMDVARKDKVLKDLKEDKNLLVNLYINMILGSGSGMYGPNFENLVVTEVDGHYARVPTILGALKFTPMGKVKTFENNLTPEKIQEFVTASGEYSFIEDKAKAIYANPTPEQIKRLREFIDKELPVIHEQLKAEPSKSKLVRDIRNHTDGEEALEALNGRIEEVMKFSDINIRQSLGLGIATTIETPPPVIVPTPVVETKPVTPVFAPVVPLIPSPVPAAGDEKATPVSGLPNVFPSTGEVLGAGFGSTELDFAPDTQQKYAGIEKHMVQLNGNRFENPKEPLLSEMALFARGKPTGLQSLVIQAIRDSLLRVARDKDSMVHKYLVGKYGDNFEKRLNDDYIEIKHNGFNYQLDFLLMEIDSAVRAVNYLDKAVDISRNSGKNAVVNLNAVGVGAWRIQGEVVHGPVGLEVGTQIDEQPNQALWQLETYLWLMKNDKDGRFKQINKIQYVLPENLPESISKPQLKAISDAGLGGRFNTLNALNTFNNDDTAPDPNFVYIANNQGDQRSGPGNEFINGGFNASADPLTISATTAFVVLTPGLNPHLYNAKVNIQQPNGAVTEIRPKMEKPGAVLTPTVTVTPAVTLSMEKLKEPKPGLQT